jgi:hypothetical protein
LSNLDADPFRESLTLVDALRRRHPTSAYTDWLDGSRLEIPGVDVGGFDLAELTGIARLGHSVEFSIEAGFQAGVTIRPPGAFAVTLISGDFLSTFAGQELADVEQAFHAGQGDTFLRLCAALRCTVRITVRVRPDVCGFHWIRTSSALVDPISPENWWDTVQGLFRLPTVTELVIEDAGNRWIAASGITVHGPECDPPRLPGYDTLTWEAYRRSWLNDGRGAFPAPPATQLRTNDGLEEVAQYLARVSHALCWLWLATSAAISPKGIHLTFEHTAHVTLDLHDLPELAGADDAMRLAEWATASADYMRHDAVQQAVSTAAAGPTTILECAGRILLTAKVLLNLAQSGAVAEALASRRAAVQAAVDAARATSEAARGAARSSSDRAYAEIAAGIGIILANASSVINATLAHWLILLVGALTLVTGVSAYAFEYPAARHTLESYELDLNKVSVILTKHDIADIGKLQSLMQARRDVLRAQIITGLLLVFAAGALGVGWFAVK